MGLRYRSTTLLLGRGGQREERVRLAVPNLGREVRREYKAGPGHGSLDSLLREAGLGEEAARLGGVRGRLEAVQALLEDKVRAEAGGIIALERERAQLDREVADMADARERQMAASKYTTILYGWLQGELSVAELLENYQAQSLRCHNKPIQWIVSTQSNLSRIYT